MKTPFGEDRPWLPAVIQRGSLAPAAAERKGVSVMFKLLMALFMDRKFGRRRPGRRVGRVSHPTNRFVPQLDTFEDRTVPTAGFDQALSDLTAAENQLVHLVTQEAALPGVDPAV